MGSIAETGAPPLARWRISVPDFHRMAEVGIFGPDDRVELIDGELIMMAPIGTRHAACVARLVRVLQSAVGNTALIWPQNPLALADDTEVYPDLCLLRPRDDFYAGAVPRPRDALLVVEVSDTTLGFDRGEKRRLYAAAGIAEYWVLDVAAGRMFVYRDPAEGGYRLTETPGPEDDVAPVLLPGLRLAPRGLFG